MPLKNTHFFNNFFNDIGLYRNYVSWKDEKLINKLNNYLRGNKNTVIFLITLRIKITELDN